MVGLQKAAVSTTAGIDIPLSRVTHIWFKPGNMVTCEGCSEHNCRYRHSNEYTWFNSNIWFKPGNIVLGSLAISGLNQDLPLKFMVWLQKAAVSTTAGIDTQLGGYKYLV